MLGSLDGAIRKYQDPAQAMALAAQSAEDGVNRDRLRLYLVNLASERERQYDIMDREAQRCRAIVISQPPASGPGRKK